MNIRLFIAIRFTPDVISKLCGLTDSLKRDSVSGNFSARENLHITEAFIGEVSAEDVPLIKGIVDAVKFEPFSICLDSFGKFHSAGSRFGAGREDEGSLYWIGCGNAPELLNIHKALTRSLREAHISVDTKPFRPHVTLGRRCVMKHDFDEEAFRKNIPEMEVTVSRISLMKSERIKGKMVYTEL